MAKKKIRVHTPFNFTHSDGTSQRFEAGEHTVDESVAGHWFVTAHADVNGDARNGDDDKAFQALIDSLTTQLADKDKTIGDLQLSVTEKDATIADLTTQLAALQAPASNTAPEGEGNVKKPKSADSK